MTSGLADLRADCSRCAALCCVVLPYRRDSGFGADKDGGVPCVNLLTDDRCGIHDRLRETGWSGCAAFDCFGAGQLVTGQTYAGRSWRDGSADPAEIGAVLTVVRLLNEMLHHLREVQQRADDATAGDLVARILQLRDRDAEGLLGVDVDDLQAEVGGCLRAASARIRQPAGADLARADLAGEDLRGRDLHNADLTGALLIGADLRGLVLDGADLLGADLRGADLGGADLAGSLFVTASQLGAATGSLQTRIAPWLQTPKHWDRSADTDLQVK